MLVMFTAISFTSCSDDDDRQTMISLQEHTKEAFLTMTDRLQTLLITEAYL